MRKRIFKAHRCKRGAFPDIPVADKLRRLLLLLGLRPEWRLFDIRPMTFRRLFEKAREASGLPHFTWRDLRRTFGSHFTMATKDRASLRKLLGHRTNFMVDRYAYLDDDHLAAQMRIFDAAMPELPAVQRIPGPAGAEQRTCPQTTAILPSGRPGSEYAILGHQGAG